MPTPEQMAAAVSAYAGSSAFAQGIITDDFRAQLQQHGEAPRWWKAFKTDDDSITGPSGETVEGNSHIYIEQTLADTVKVMVTETQREVFTEEFGLLPKGQTQIACCVDEIELARGDRVLLPSRLFKERIAILPTAGVSSLQRKYVSEIVEVIYDGAVMDSSEYSLSSDANDIGRITWVNGAPAGTVLIEFRYNPLYVYLDVSDRNPPRGADGERLLQRGILTLEQKIDEGEG